MILSRLSTEELNWPERYRALAKTSKDARLKHFYEVGIQQGDTSIEQAQFVALDFETTGLDSNSDDIVSIGLVPFNYHRIFCAQAKHWIIAPKQTLDEDSIVIHGITHSEISDAPDLTHILQELLEALSNKVVVVHYQYIERTFLNNALLKRINEGIEFALIDTMVIEHRALLQRQSMLARFFKKKLGSLRLGDSRTRYNLPVYHGHNALTDALATAELLQAQLRHHCVAHSPLSQLWL